MEILMTDASHNENSIKFTDYVLDTYILETFQQQYVEYCKAEELNARKISLN